MVLPKNSFIFSGWGKGGDCLIIITCWWLTFQVESSIINYGKIYWKNYKW
jgi:hypothetical protein